MYAADTFRVSSFSLFVVLLVSMLLLSNSLHVSFHRRFCWRKNNAQSFAHGMRSAGSASSSSSRYMSYLVEQTVDRKTVSGGPANNRLNVADRANLIKPATKLQPKPSNGQYQFTHTELPEETMYIFDGTAMLFSAYFSAEALANGNFTNKNNPKYESKYPTKVSKGSKVVKPTTAPAVPVPVVPAVLSAELNKKIIASMTDAQVRAMIDSFNAADFRSRAKAAAESATIPAAGGDDVATTDVAFNDGDSATSTTATDDITSQPITAADRAALQLRCDPLVNMLMQFARLVRDIKPKYVAVAFDAGRVTFRRELYPAYKLQRTETPAMLVPLFPLVIRVLEAVGCVCLVQKGFEADDLMASLGKWAKDRGLNVVHYSQDKDMLQLVEPGVHVMLPKGREMIDAARVQEKYDIAHPSSMRDLQALMGDSADNIPGVKGIGEKTAATLLKHFHSVPEMYRRLGLIGLPPLPPHLTNALPTSQLVKSHMLSVMPKHIMDSAIAELSVCFDGSSGKAATALARLYMCGYENVCLYKHLVTLKDDVDIEQIVLRSAYNSNSDVVDRYKAKVEVIAATADLPQTHESTAQVQGLVSAMQDVLLDRAAGANILDASTVDANTVCSTLPGVHSVAPRLTTNYFRYRGERGAHAEALTSSQSTITATTTTATTSHTSTTSDAGKAWKRVGSAGRSPAAPTPAAAKKHQKAVQQRSAEQVEALLHDISPALAAPLRLLREQYHRLPKD